MSDVKSPPVKSGGKKKWFLMLVVGIISVGAGILTPVFLRGSTSSETAEESSKEPQDAFLAFGEVTVNLAQPKLERFLRVKLVLMVDAEHQQALTERLEQRKAVLKSWLIAYLSDKSLEQVKGRASVNRIRREILEYFSSVLCPRGEEHVRDILFEEFVVQ
jgi:flagellar basal body-associated protein FliL